MIISRKKYEADLAAAKEQGRAEMQEHMWRNERLNEMQSQINRMGEDVGALVEAMGKKRGLAAFRHMGNVRTARGW